MSTSLDHGQHQKTLNRRDRRKEHDLALVRSAADCIAEEDRLLSHNPVRNQQNGSGTIRRNVAVPSSTLPQYDEHSAVQGQFTVAKANVGKRMRSQRAQDVIELTKAGINDWLDPSRTVYPEQGSSCDQETVYLPGEYAPKGISRQKLSYQEMIWTCTAGWERYIIHATARWLGVVSFSMSATA